MHVVEIIRFNSIQFSSVFKSAVFIYILAYTPR